MDNQNIHLAKNELETIPFVDIIMTYTGSFSNKLEEINASVELVNKLHLILLHELSIAAEVTLQDELDYFINNGQSDYQEFIEATNLLLAVKHPVLDKILKTKANNYSTHIQNIFSRYSQDFNLILKCFSLKANNNIIKDIDTSLGDGHSGESTSLITLSDGTKLIYKPRNIDTANSYNLFIDWINNRLNTNLKTLKCLSCENYGWLEFVVYEGVNSPDELKEYYYKAGILLAVAFLLGSKDCHYENIIASGKNPVIIDHETIIQPVLSNQFVRTWDEQNKIPHFSVLESMLIANRDTGVPLECVGYGIKGNVEAIDFEKKVINPNTIDSKRDTRFVFRKLIKENIPLYNDKLLFANSYKKVFKEGFSTTYDLFMASREELISCNSPIRFFVNKQVRYVWRPTFVYFKILKYLRGTSFMESFDTYQSKLYELLSKAYKGKNMNEYRFILEFEMNQMIKGDIPIFSLKSTENFLEGNKSFRIFEQNCMENIYNRIEMLSEKHKEDQLEFIKKWLKIQKI